MNSAFQTRWFVCFTVVILCQWAWSLNWNAINVLCTGKSLKTMPYQLVSYLLEEHWPIYNNSCILRFLTEHTLFIWVTLYFLNAVSFFFAVLFLSLSFSRIKAQSLFRHIMFFQRTFNAIFKYPNPWFYKWNALIPTELLCSCTFEKWK